MTDIKTYARKVKDMREAQVMYFQAKKDKMQAVANDWLKKSKALEKEVNEMTDAILAGSTQEKLF